MGHDHGHATGRAQDRTRLRWVLAVTAVVLVVELVGVDVAGSLALLADAGHMATDAGAIVLALAASYLATRPASNRSTFGWHRAEILAAAINALVLLGVCVFLAVAGYADCWTQLPVDAGPMVAFAVVGLVANTVALAILSRGDTGSLNMRGAVLEVAGDLVGSVLAVVAGLVIWTTGFDRADALASLAIAILIPAAGDRAAAGLVRRPPRADPTRPRTGRRPYPPARRRRGDRRPRPARLDDHERPVEHVGPRHRARRGAGDAGESERCSTSSPTASPSTSRCATRPSRWSPSRTASTRTWVRPAATEAAGLASARPPQVR